LRLVIRKDAEADIAEGCDWYELKRSGLGNKFIEEVSATIDAVHAEPLRFPVIHRQLRRAIVHRFPYGVFFLRRSDAVIVVAVIYLGRNPRWFHGRVR